MAKVSKKFRRMMPIYEHFASSFSGLDLSEEAALAMYEYETYGKGDIKNDIFGGTKNGYAIGKKWMDITISCWRETILEGLMYKDELYEWFPEDFHWWLDKVVGDLNNCYPNELNEFRRKDDKSLG